jgi:hypothetical protein
MVHADWDLNIDYLALSAVELGKKSIPWAALSNFKNGLYF